MSPKIINKQTRMTEIAFLAYEFLLKTGIKNFTVASLLEHLEISKGTFYHYFQSKDELIAKIFYILSLSYMQTIGPKLKEAQNIQEQLFILFDIYLHPTEQNKDFLNLYNEYLLVYSGKNNKNIKQYNKDYHLFISKLLEDIFTNAHKQKKIKAVSKSFIHSILATADGIFVHSQVLPEYILEDEIKKYLTELVVLLNDEDK